VHNGPTAGLRRALATFVAGGKLPGYVRGHIAESWQRSLRSQLSPNRLDIRFDPELDDEGLLVRAARPVLDQFASDLAASRVAVLLTDERGLVLDRRASEPSLVVLLDRALLAPGYVYAEDVVGTNGIGTALAQRSPIVVEGEEHFADALTGLACAGAPITDPRTGRTAGLIALVCVANEANELMLPFATGAAREIEQRLVDDASVSERLVMQRFLQERRGAKGPLVVLTPRTMITNAAADRLVEPQDEHLLREIADRLPDRRHGDTCRLVLSGGAEVTARAERVVEGAFVAGTVLRLSLAGAASPARSRPATFGWESLTATERSVVELVAQGLTNREAAERLFLSHHTVGFHLRSIYRKLNVTSRVDLTRVAVEQSPFTVAPHGA
jgi:transcriptional regulator of acetoin/glycerol metabolism/DNA-binding CsgD family transcriptional regulator